MQICHHIVHISVPRIPPTQHNLDLTGRFVIMPPTTVAAFPAASPSLTAQPISLKFEEIVYKVKVGRQRNWWCAANGGCRDKTILNGITGVVSPGEMLAMLGPSGSGKTTLLTALGGRLNGRNGMLSGKITYNGQPFSGPIRRRIGFVVQDDVFYAHLTVRETLVFTALLRLPSSLTPAEKVAQAEQVIAELGLARVAESVVGGPRLRGISGGEKKRLSIGLEMLVNPSLLLLDEPTSGLDSTTAQRMLTMLKRLTTSGRTVVTTIHQPSCRIYNMFDKVILLSEGSPIYHGRASAALEYFSSLGFSFTSSGCTAALNPADLMLDLANGISPEDADDEKPPPPLPAPTHPRPTPDQSTNAATVGREKQRPKSIKETLVSAYDRNIATTLKAELCMVDVSNTTTSGVKTSRFKETQQWSTTWCEQFCILLRRGLKERRHEAFHKLRIFQVLSVAMLAGLLWWQTPPSHIQDRTALLFFFSVFWGFYPLYNAVFTFPQERSMLIKERSSGMYRLSSYFLARTAGDLPMELALPTAFTIIIYWMGGLKPDLATFILSLVVVLFSVLVSQSLGLAFGAILMDVKQATTLASVTTMVFLVAGGYYVQHIPPWCDVQGSRLPVNPIRWSPQCLGGCVHHGIHADRISSPCLCGTTKGSTQVEALQNPNILVFLSSGKIFLLADAIDVCEEGRSTGGDQREGGRILAGEGPVTSGRVHQRRRSAIPPTPLHTRNGRFRS